MTRSIRSPEVVPLPEGLIAMRTVRRHAKPFAPYRPSTSRRSRPGPSCAPRATRGAGSTGPPPRRPSWRTGPRPDSSTGTSPERATTPGRPTWPRPPHRTPSGLPLDGAGGRDHGAHGPFDDEAAAHSPYTALDRHPAAVGAAVGTAALVARVLLGRPGAARRPRAEGR
ncbi:hypothetical protein [Streptomyces exfoliatus]|uniref:hypothetical protein n=1 Tax=Streptomyces exfoliatus TaxID=1905 RepID=UPI0004C48666|nr:hypothetical protein [Streptomyces exfoliatus]